ncbi:MAG TPA: 3'(2'),5'-bisphosphate nucleotidase CysQ [Candidatus Binatia bacterium]|nr:3'(2'),5'-bisphosphate nucleotidase CysQ [Candidatus Binatia bacterium]
MTAFAREREVAVAAARAAGAIVRRYYEEGGVEVRQKGPDSPLTKADLEANACIRRHVAAAFPADGWLSEETADSTERLGKRRVWVVDPLDGTKEFIQHIPEFCVCVALTEDGRPVVAVEYNPAAERLYVAVRGQGTTVNGAPARVSATRDVAGAVVLASRSEDKRGEWDAFKPHCRVTLTGSVAFKLAELAAGHGDATFTLTPKNEWDICAGVLLVEEAGGRATDLDGRPLVFNQPSPLRPGMIASNGILHAPLLALVDALAPGAGR